MATVFVNFNNTIKKIKPMHAVGQPPLLGTNTKMFKYLQDAYIPYSRLHDVGGWFGGNLFVDIPNVFRDFEADENDPSSYDFAFTDMLIADLIKNGCQPIYRLGVTIENFHTIKAYRIFPPKDMEKWARVCEKIIRHYNEGWANGFFYDIKYWEIWNEPDGHPDISQNAMWKGTKEEYFKLYKITASHLRKCFGNTIKIGGYASCGFYRAKEIQNVTGEAFGTQTQLTDWDKRIDYFMEFFHDFIKFVKDEKLPFDFFSHHSYSSVEDNIKMQAYAEKYLKKEGFENVEIHLNEWNTNPRIEERGTSIACASAVALMCVMQNMKMDVMCYYDARVGISVYGGLFNPMTHQPLCTYYGFQAFGNLYKLGTQTECVVGGEKVYALSATDGENGGVLISNLGDDCEIKTNLPDSSIGYIIDENNFLVKREMDVKSFVLEKNQVVYFELKIN